MSQNENLIEKDFLSHLKNNHILSTIFLVNGVRLTGFVSSFDSMAIILKRESEPTQMIYRHAISTVVQSVQSGFYGGANKAGVDNSGNDL